MKIILLPNSNLLNATIRHEDIQINKMLFCKAALKQCVGYFLKYIHYKNKILIEVEYHET